MAEKSSGSPSKGNLYDVLAILVFPLRALTANSSMGELSSFFFLLRLSSFHKFIVNFYHLEDCVCLMSYDWAFQRDFLSVDFRGF